MMSTELRWRRFVHWRGVLHTPGRFFASGTRERVFFFVKKNVGGFVSLI